MKKTLKNTVMFLSLGAMILVPGLALAQPAGGDGDGFRRGGGFGKGRHGRMMKGLQRMKAELNLSEAQQQQLQAIRQSARQEMQTYRQQVKALRVKMRALLQAPVIDESQVYALRAQIQPLNQLMADKRFKTKLAMLQVLSPEQRQKMVELRKEFRGKMKQRFGGRGGFSRGAGQGQAQQ